MRTFNLTLAVAIALTLCAGNSAHAKKAPDADEALNLERGVAAVDNGVEKVDGRFAQDGSAIALYGSEFRARPASPSQMAAQYLDSEYAKLGLSADDVDDFATYHLREDSVFSVVRLRQSRQGLPVYGSDLAISVTPAGKILFVANSSVRNLGAVDAAKADRTANQALTTARSYLGVATQDEHSTKMVYVTADGTTRIVWRVEATPVAKLGSWELLVDAETGEVLRAKDVANYVDGTTTVHMPDPLSSARQTYNNATGYGDNNNADSPQLTAELRTANLRDITLTAGVYSLVGPNAECQEYSAPADGACPTQASPAFTFTRGSLFYDALSIYYHIDTYMRYVNTTLGVPARPSVYTSGVRYDPHSLSGDDNADYVGGSSQRLRFGQGGVDDSQDPDVIIHELGHGIHDWITGNQLSQVQGLSEGFGDYVGSAYSRDFPNQWTPADPQYFWMFSWDGHNEYWSGRVTNWQLTHTYPSNLGTPAPHTPGQYWASCNLVARDLMGGAIMDKAYFMGLSMTGATTNQKDAAQAISNAATALGYNNAQMTSLNYAYNAGNTGGNNGCTYAVTVIIPAANDLIFKNGFDGTP